MSNADNGRERGRKLVERIYTARASQAEFRRPNGLRPSELGHECTRYLWYRFRWADEHEEFDGRMLRLFETGQLMESRFVKELRSVGAEVFDVDPDNPKEQISISTFGGHTKGYLDSVAGDIPFTDNSWLAVEYKTHSEKSYKLLDKDGVAIAKPTHYAQMQLYMDEHSLSEALYMACNKNTDQLYCEFVAHDARYIERLRAKADVVINRFDIPQRLNNTPTFFQCKFCSASDVCHHGKLPFRTCRNCAFSHAITEKERETHGCTKQNMWVCDMHGKLLDLDDQRAGCPDHRHHPHIVMGDSVGDMKELEGPSGEVNFGYKFSDGRPDYTDTGPSGDR